MRGTLHRRAACFAVPRFIPACAGNAPAMTDSKRTMPVHPRVCGERLFEMVVRRGQGGSSPRVRGTPTAQRGRQATGRFIPACAGNALSSPDRLASIPVHPRVCGERERHAGGHQKSWRFIPACAGNAHGSSGLLRRCAGSSPRVRGTPRVRHVHQWSNRFIPACAGNASSSPPVPVPVPVHPRVCGERPNRASSSRRDIGSSPRVRTAVRGKSSQKSTG